MLEHFQQKWTPVLRKKMRKNKELERSTEPSEVKTALEQFLKSVKRFSGENCGKNKGLEQLIEPSETKTALEHFRGKNGYRVL